MRHGHSSIVVAACLLAACELALGQGSVENALTPPAPEVQVYRDVGGTKLNAFVFTPPPSATINRPAVLIFHGGGWVTGKAEWEFKSARRFAQLGLVAISIDYRLAVGAVSPVEQLSDVCEAFRWTRANAAPLGIDPLRVAGYGVSAGGQLLAAAGTIGCGSPDGSLRNGGPDAMLLLSPAVDAVADRLFVRLMVGRGKALAYSPSHQVHSRIAPTIVVQGDADTVTPLRRAQDFCARVVAHAGSCVIHTYAGVGHVLTRNLAGNQNIDIDPDPAAVTSSNEHEATFLRELWPQTGG
jgi:acetyl esterase